MFVFGKKKEDEDINIIALEEPKGRESDVFGGDEITFSNRLTEVENRLAKMDASFILFRNESDQLVEKIGKVEKEMQDMLSMYEVISNQVNPFLDNKSTGGVMIEDKLKEMDERTEDRIKELREIYGRTEDRIGEIDGRMYQLRDDLSLIISMQVDLDRIIDETILEEVI
jgi:archaellum component FlaC